MKRKTKDRYYAPGTGTATWMPEVGRFKLICTSCGNGSDATWLARYDEPPKLCSGCHRRIDWEIQEKE